MGWTSEDNRAESAIDVAAAAIFAAAVGFALWAGAVGGQFSAAVVAAAFFLAWTGLRGVPADPPSYGLPAFSPVPIEPAPEQQDDAVGELILQDRLATVSPDARVVQLFGPGQNPLHSSRSSMAPDASQALNEALAELRRSLR